MEKSYASSKRDIVMLPISAAERTGIVLSLAHI